MVFIATIKSSLVLNDQMSNALNRINTAMTATIDACEAMGTSMGEAFDVQNFNNARVAIGEANAVVKDMESSYKGAAAGQEKLNQKIYEGKTAANGLLGKISSLVSVYSLIRGGGKLFDMSDEITSTTARLNLMNDGLQTTDELLNMVYGAAQNSRGSLSGMSAVVARMGNNVGIGEGKVFDSSGEVVAFSELIQKQMTIAGASASEAENAIIQLSQGLASGTLRGDELNSVAEQAPGIIQNIADYLDVPSGKIREIASEGGITADIVKNAMFNAAGDINQKFDTMPMTWEQVCQSMANTTYMNFVRPVSEKITEITSDPRFKQMLSNIQGVFTPLANITISLLDKMASAAYFVSENFSLIAPAIGVVVSVLGAYAIALGVIKNIEVASNAIKVIEIGLEYAKAAAKMKVVEATTAEAAAQMGLNTAILSSPVFWIAAVIIVIVAALYLVVAAINRVTGSTISATGIIFGSVMWLVSVIINIVIGCINAIIQIIWTVFVEPFIGIVEWVLNACMGGFNSFGGMVANLIGQIISWFLTLGQVVTKIIDAIFGTNWTGGLEALKGKVNSWGKSDDSITIDREAPTLNRVESTEWFNTGYNFGSNFASGISDKLSGVFDSDSYGSDSYATGVSDIANNTGSTAGSAGNISDSLDKTNEELEWIRDIAEREVINRFTTAEVKVDFTGMTNQISNDMDLDGVISAFTGKFKESLQTAAQGVY